MFIREPNFKLFKILNIKNRQKENIYIYIYM